MGCKNMKVAIVGSRGLTVSNLGNYLPDGVTEIVSGGARGIDTCAKEYAISNRIKLTEFLPEYEKYGKSALLKRNITIIRVCGFGAGFLGWSFPWNKVCDRQL